MVLSPTYFQLLLEFARGVYWPPQSSMLAWTGFWRRCHRDQAAFASLGNVKISYLDFAGDAVILAETLIILEGRLEALNEESELLGFCGSKRRSRLSVTSWMLPSCLYLFVVRMLRLRRDSLNLAMIFRSRQVVSQRSIDIWVGPGESWIH